jgi:anthranilate synthase
MSQTVIAESWAISSDDNIALDLLAHLREYSLIGEAEGVREYGAPDELLMHSGGPLSDISRYSMLAGPCMVRYVARQPSRDEIPALVADHSPLAGELRLNRSRPELAFSEEHWDGEQWTHRTTITGSDLASALRACAERGKPTQSAMGSAVISGTPDDVCLPVRPGILSGLLTYEMLQWTEPLSLRHPPQEDEVLAILWRVDRWLVHDRAEGRLHLQITFDDEWSKSVSRLLSNLTDSTTDEIRLPARPPIQKATLRQAQSESDEEHAGKVRQVQQAIREGVLYQLNYGRIWQAEIDDPWEVFQRLSTSNPAPYSSWLHTPDLGLAIASSSPEMLLKQQGRHLATRPIKGTRPRGDDSEMDANLRGELAGSRKEVAEHLMLVDLERNDLGRVCKAGTTRWNRWRIESYPNVQHMVSEIVGELRDDADGFDALQAVFPGGSITGCPKSATIAAIDEIEQRPRRAWTGSIGHIDHSRGISEWNILIRTLEATMVKGASSGGPKQWHAVVQAGGGLVIESDPLQEVEEARWKAHALAEAAWGGEDDGGARIAQLSEVSIHPIPPITATVRSLIASRDTDLVRPSTDALPQPIVWSENMQLHKPAEGVARVLFIDNLDSFSWNIVHAFASLGAEVISHPGRADSPTDLAVLLKQVTPTHVVLGPGPGRPEMSSITMQIARNALAGELLSEHGERLPLLGICLGHQAIGIAAGWPLIESPLGAVHGVPEAVESDEGILLMTRYHSLMLAPDEIQAGGDLCIVANDAATKTIPMALTHNSLPITAYQFHPESAGSVGGSGLLGQFLEQ